VERLEGGGGWVALGDDTGSVDPFCTHQQDTNPVLGKKLPDADL